MKKAILYMVISAFAFTLLNVFVKSLNAFSVYQIVFFRSVGSLFFTIPFLIKLKISPLGNQRLLLVLRSVVGLTSMILFFMSLKFIEVGTAVALRYIAPIFAAIFALFILKEKIKYYQWLCFLVAFAGVVILKGFDTALNSQGVIYAVLSAIFAGFVYILIRKIGDKDHPVVVVNYFMVISAIIGGLLSINNWTTPTWTQFLILMSLGVFGYFAQLFMTKALQMGETNQVAPFKYLEVIFTMILGLVWFNEQYTLVSVAGVLLIIIGLTFNVVLKSSNAKK